MDTAVAERVLERLDQLLVIPSVVGYEGPLMRYLVVELERMGMQVRRNDGCVAGLGPAGPATVLSAHVDRHGLVCTGPGTYAYAAHFLPAIRGSRNGFRHAFATTVCNQFADESVRAYDPQTGSTVADGRVAHMAVCGIDDLGIAVPVDGLGRVGPATPIAFQPRLVRTQYRVSAQMDNVLGVAMTLVLVEQGFGGLVVFTAEEEIGGSWRYLNRELLQHPDPPSTLLLIDTSPFEDSEAVDAGAVVLRWQDARATFSIPTVQQLISVAQSEGVPIVVKDRLIQRLDEERRAAGRPEQGLGETELGRLVHGTAGWANGAMVQVPTTNYHTNSETTSTSAIANAMAVLRSAIG